MQARDLAARLNLKRSGRSWRGTCPACGYPRAFALRQGKPDQVQTFCANGCDRSALRDVLAGHGAPASPRSVAEADASAVERRQAAALRLAMGSAPAMGTLADTYLTWRALPGLAASPALRFRPDTPHPEAGKLPAMVALVADSAGRTIAVHRTYLAPDGNGKAAVTPDRASLGPVWGGVIRLAEPGEDGAIVIGEGIETAASAGRLIGLPAWAAISAGNLARGLVLPPAISRVVIAVDPDPPGRAAARDAADRWIAAGLCVSLMRPVSDGDFNDVLRARGGCDAR